MLAKAEIPKLSVYIKYLSSYKSWIVSSFATFFISAASLVEILVIANKLSFKKFVWMLIFIGVGGGGGGTSFAANRVYTNSIQFIKACTTFHPFSISHQTI
jgi:D-serine dehydratase